jgi:outer membrane lipoprotein SlyB
MSAVSTTLKSGRGRPWAFASRGDAQTASLCLVAALFAAPWVSEAFAAEDGTGQPKPQSGAAATCRDCGVVRSIREIRTERKGSQLAPYVNSPEYLQSRPFDQQPLVGPAISFSWGAGAPTQPRVGAVGSPEMQQRFIDVSYEITVRFDDGRYGIIEQPDPGDLRVGDRVRVVKGLVERWK